MYIIYSKICISNYEIPNRMSKTCSPIYKICKLACIKCNTSIYLNINKHVVLNY